MDKDWIPIIIAIIAAGPGFFALLGQRKKDKREDKSNAIDNAGKVTAQALALLAPLQLQVTSLEEKISRERTEAEAREAALEAKIDKLIAESEDRDKKIGKQDEIIKKQSIRLTDNENQIKNLKTGIKKLIDQIIRLGHVPDWQPDFTEGE